MTKAVEAQASSARLLGSGIAKWIVTPEPRQGPPRPSQRKASAAVQGLIDAVCVMLQHTQVISQNFGTAAEQTGNGFATLAADLNAPKRQPGIYPWGK